MTTTPIRTAVITGAKTYDVIGFHRLFRNLAGIDAYIQHIDDFAAAHESVRDSYDVVLFYFMALDGPSDAGLPGYCGRPKAAIEHLGETGQGLVVLHHALLAYPDWPVWDAIVGMADRTLAGYRHDETLAVHVADTDHPITRGLSDWTLVDETYDMADAGVGNHLLLSVEHAKSMRTLAWTRQHQRSRVCVLQLGHDNQAWANPHFRTVLKRGIGWSAGKR